MILENRQVRLLAPTGHVVRKFYRVFCLLEQAEVLACGEESINHFCCLVVPVDFPKSSNQMRKETCWPLAGA
jgi:hypothetical protein